MPSPKHFQGMLIPQGLLPTSTSRTSSASARIMHLTQSTLTAGLDPTGLTIPQHHEGNPESLCRDSEQLTQASSSFATGVARKRRRRLTDHDPQQLWAAETLSLSSTSKSVTASQVLLAVSSVFAERNEEDSEHLISTLTVTHSTSATTYPRQREKYEGENCTS
jgi:hypothetical protein